MRKGIAVMLIVLLGGCASPGDVMQRAPYASLTSAKAPAAVIGCVSPAVLRDWSMSKQVSKADGQAIVVSGSAWGEAVAVIEVQPGTSGSDVVVRKGAATERVISGVVSQVKHCL